MRMVRQVVENAGGGRPVTVEHEFSWEWSRMARPLRRLCSVAPPTSECRRKAVS